MCTNNAAMPRIPQPEKPLRTQRDLMALDDLGASAQITWSICSSESPKTP
jgi:hypothetical protein